MEPFGAGGGETARLCGRVGGIDGGAGHVPFGETHDVAALEVDRGIEAERHQSLRTSQRERRASP
jgi:hypothetical protein